MSLNEKLKNTAMENWPDAIHLMMRLYWQPENGGRKYHMNDYEDTISGIFRKASGKNRFIFNAKYHGRPIMLWYDEKRNSFMVRKKNLLNATSIGQKVTMMHSTDSFLAFITEISNAGNHRPHPKPMLIGELIQWRNAQREQEMEKHRKALARIEQVTQKGMVRLRRYHQERQRRKHEYDKN